MKESKLCKIMVGEGGMIVCRYEDLEKIQLRKLVKKAFPELFAGCGYRDKSFKKVEYWLWSIDEPYSSNFDFQLALLECNHDWDGEPFMALKIFKERGESLCRAEAISALSKTDMKQ